MDQLNKEYFETKKRHKENVSRWSWLILFPFITAMLFIMFWATKKSNELTSKTAVLEKVETLESLSTSKTTENRTTVELGKWGFTLDLPAGVTYSFSDKYNLFIAKSINTNQITFVIGEISKDFDLTDPQSKREWVLNTFQKDASIKITESKGFTTVEMIDNGIHFKSLLKIIEGTNINLLMMGQSTMSSFAKEEKNIKNVMNSLKRVNEF